MHRQREEVRTLLVRMEDSEKGCTQLQQRRKRQWHAQTLSSCASPLLSEFPGDLSAPTHGPSSLMQSADPASVASAVPLPNSKPQSWHSEMH